VMANLDNCPLVANADQADSDKNGIGDACEPKPVVRCVVPEGNGQYLAIFDYTNGHSDRRIAVGSRNQFSPGAADRGQPTVQLQNGRTRVVAVPFTSSISWQLAGTTAMATPSSSLSLGGQGYAFTGRFVAKSLWVQPDCRLQYSE